MSTSLANLLTETASAHADRPALKLDDTVASYAVLNEGATRIAGLLKDKGLQPGDRVGIMLPNVPYFGVVYYGVLRAGGVVVPMNVLLKGREVAFYLEDPGAKLLFADAEPDSEMAERDGDDTAVILYTSGTTGTPKGAELTHDNLRTNCEIASTKLAQSTEDDVLLGA